MSALETDVITEETKRNVQFEGRNRFLFFLCLNLVFFLLPIIEQEYRVVLAEGPDLIDDDDRQDNDSGIQNDEKEDEEEEKIIKKKEKDNNKKPSFKIKSPKKLSNGSRSKSPSKNGLSSPEKSPKKRRKKFPPKTEKKDHDGTIIANPHFDAERTAQRYISI